jgi:hypothetical protein
MFCFLMGHIYSAHNFTWNVYFFERNTIKHWLPGAQPHTFRSGTSSLKTLPTLTRSTTLFSYLSLQFRHPREWLNFYLLWALHCKHACYEALYPEVQGWGHYTKNGLWVCKLWNFQPLPFFIYSPPFLTLAPYSLVLHFFWSQTQTLYYKTIPLLFPPPLLVVVVLHLFSTLPLVHDVFALCMTWVYIDPVQCSLQI